MRVGVALLATLATLVLAACGGGGGGSESLSADEFRQQADALCKEFEQKLDDLGTPSSADELGSFVDNAIPIIEDGNDALAELEPPEELAADWDRALELQKQNLEVARDLQDAIHDNDLTKVQELVTKLDETDAESTALARKIGLEECGQQNT
jgi:hypothetical protein